MQKQFATRVNFYAELNSLQLVCLVTRRNVAVLYNKLTLLCMMQQTEDRFY